MDKRLEFGTGFLLIISIFLAACGGGGDENVGGGILPTLAPTAESQAPASTQQAVIVPEESADGEDAEGTAELPPLPLLDNSSETSIGGGVGETDFSSSSGALTIAPFDIFSSTNFTLEAALPTEPSER